MTLRFVFPKSTHHRGREAATWTTLLISKRESKIFLALIALHSPIILQHNKESYSFKSRKPIPFFPPILENPFGYPLLPYSFHSY